MDNPNTRWEWYVANVKRVHALYGPWHKLRYSRYTGPKGTATTRSRLEGVWWHCELEQGEQVWLHCLRGNAQHMTDLTKYNKHSDTWCPIPL